MLEKKIVCESCKKEFVSNLSRDNGYTARFCSRACITPKIKKVCLGCNKEYYVIPYRLETSKWCSKICMMNNQEIPTHIYETQEWRKARKEALERDNFTCQVCNKTEEETKLHVNHIIPYRLIRSHILANLVTLCISCHPHTDWVVRDLLQMPEARKRFLELIINMWHLNLKKSNNYAKTDDPLSNFKGTSIDLNIEPWRGCLLRMGDKWSRLMELAKGKPDEVGESITDTLMDMAVYSLLCIILIEEDAAIKIPLDK